MSENTPLDYVVDEKKISRNLGFDISYPIRVFTLESLGINELDFISFMRPQFSILHMDPYDAKRNKVKILENIFPEEKDHLQKFLADYYIGQADLEAVVDLISRLEPKDRHAFDRVGMTARRKRSIARFVVSLTSKNIWRIQRVPAPEFKQAVGKDDARSFVRKFHEMSSLVTEYPCTKQMIRSIAGMVREVKPEAKKLEITMHMMFVFADALTEGDNSPEGIHKDGADYIVSALVIERAGIMGGTSIVYDDNQQNVYLEYTLQQGQGLFQDDRNLWHYVTPIQENHRVPPPYGNRSIIGFDINIL